jgi:ATP-dependent protease ClpP protease subunit
MYGARPMRSTRRLQNLQSTLPRWWSITNKADTGEPTLVSIYDEIGMWGVSAGEFLAELTTINGDLDVHISSPGGDVFDAIAIYNSLKARRGVVAITVDGLAASAASFIAQAASPGKLEMAPFSTMMIHDGFAAGIGNAADMRDLADQLDSASDNIAGIYAARTGKPVDYWRAKMRATTWYKDTEAVADGLADRVHGQDGDIRATWDLSVFNGTEPGKKTGSNGQGDDAGAAGDVPLGDGWVTGADGNDRYDPDGDGDDDSTAEGDTDNSHFDKNGKQIKAIPPKPGTKGNPPTKKTDSATVVPKPMNADAEVDNSPWDAPKAWHNGTVADDPAAFYEGICAGKKSGDPSTQAAWALPYKYHPSDPPNAAGVRAGLARLSQTQGLINKSEAQNTLEAAMKKVNPDWKPGDQVDPALLSAVLVELVGGGK